MSNLITMKNIVKTYDGKRNVLNGLNFSLGKGEIATIMGSSGCGKSTFLNIVGLLDKVSDGEYYFNGTPIKKNKMNSYYIYRSNDLGFVFQSYFLIDSLTVEENILMPFLYNEKKVDETVKNAMDSILEVLNLSDLKYKKTAVLSGGERQRVAIARAIVKAPKLLIADEPTGNLDESNGKQVVEALKKISEQGVSIIIATHDRGLVFGNEKKYILEEGILRRC
ncbi:MAG: ABC transporter ATP-binding protein [Lachnospiraceae bacterium]|nr:ABC transporter ATP-binding protein [Lachnospiraceae bacterium]